jgi:precorrin-6Y C5,15-methyltransferase (decarboxylating)
MPKITVVGIDGTRSLSHEAISSLMSAETVIATRRLDELFKKYDLYDDVKNKLEVEANVDRIMDFLGKSQGPVVVLASGDPMFFGLGKRISEVFGRDDVSICPGLSSIQLGFSKARIYWQDAYFMSLHGSMRRQWDIKDVALVLERHPKLAILTGGENTPGRIAGHLPDEAKIIVLERLGYDDEGMYEADARDIRKMEFKNPNFMIVMHEGNELPVFGISEPEFRHENGLITKDEVRAVVLHSLKLPLKGILWDVGSGSGSVAIESKRISPSLEVYAIERNPSRVKDIMYNAISLNAGRISVVEGEAPDVLEGLPLPDRVFVGGAGDNLKDVIKYIDSKMGKGILVITAITLESLHAATGTLRFLGLRHEISSVSVSRAESIGSKEYLKAMNQIFIIKAEK